jgi:hypothetical protein
MLRRARWDGSLLATGLGRAQGPQPVQEWLQLWA